MIFHQHKLFANTLLGLLFLLHSSARGDMVTYEFDGFFDRAVDNSPDVSFGDAFSATFSYDEGAPLHSIVEVGTRARYSTGTISVNSGSNYYVADEGPQLQIFNNFITSSSTTRDDFFLSVYQYDDVGPGFYLIQVNMIDRSASILSDLSIPSTFLIEQLGANNKATLFVRRFSAQHIEEWSASGRFSVVGDKDTDGDGVIDKDDNCPTVSNPDQSDIDGNEIGDECDAAIIDNDLDVFKPKHNSVTTNPNPIVYFRYDPNAEGYLVDLIGQNSNRYFCDGSVVFQGHIPKESSDCSTTTGNHVGEVGSGDGKPAFPPDVSTRICRWTPPISLNNGYYALSITAFDQNTGSLIQNAGIQDNLARDTDCEDRYQKFEIDAGTSKPQAIAPMTPMLGFSCDANTGTSNSGDCRPVVKGTNATESVDTSASWMQIWVNDEGGNNLTSEWYQVKVGGSVPSNKVHCTTTGGQTTCAFPDIADALKGGAEPFSWWVRSWNAAGNSAWSTEASMTE